MGSKVVVSFFGLGFLILACGHKMAPSTVLFNGECRVEIESKTDHSEILLDGVEVGHDKVLLQVPCGEKLVEVHKTGFIPYHQYLPVSIDRPLSVEVTLQKRTKLPNPALDPALIDKVRGPIALAKKEKKTTDEAAESSANAPAAGATSDKWDRYEDWL